MAGAYTLGVFNDNFFKQAALVLAVAAGRNSMQGFALAVFTLPFLIFSAPAGWMADRFPKSKVVIGAKACELLAMLAGAAGICLGHWSLIFTMLVAYATSEGEALRALTSDPDKFVSAAPFPFLLAALIVLAFGPGWWSVDARLFRKKASGK